MIIIPVYRKIIVLILKRLIIIFMFAIPVFCDAQYNVKSLLSEDRPLIADTAKFVRELRLKADSIVKSRLGNIYYQMVDSTYFYPWYYKNVYFNSAPSEMNYRVAFWLNRTKDTHLNFELVFDKDSLKLIFPIDLYLPNCKKNPSKCNCISSVQAIAIAVKSFHNYFNSEIHASLCYDTNYHTLVWICSVRQFTKYPRGDSGYAVINANNGRVISSIIKKNVWMGR